MSDDAEAPVALSAALDLLHKASTTSAKQRTIKLSSIVDVICRHAFQTGLDDDDLRDLVQLASVKTYLDQSSLTTLIKNLYPARRIPADVVITIVGALGQGKGKPSPATQDSLVKWLTVVHGIMQDSNILSRLYGVLFGMLDMISLRTSLCHLLSLITRRKHVKPYRIQQLLVHARGLGNEPALQGLLRVYKDYYPDIILGSTATSRKSFAPRPDAEWQTRIATIQTTRTAAEESESRQHNGFKVARAGEHKKRTDGIPEVHTYHANEASVTLEGIDNVQDFVEKLDVIEPPGQMISFLTDPLLQKFVELKPSLILSSRVDLWLGISLEEEYEAVRSGTSSAQDFGHLLNGLLAHAQYTKTLQPTVLLFLKEFLPIWNGHDHVEAILGLLSYIQIEDFDETYATLLQPAERAISPQDPSSWSTIITFYTSLLEHQISATEHHQSHQPVSLDGPLHKLSAHVSNISLSLLLSLPDNSSNSPLISSILSFYELLSSASHPTSIPIILPPLYLLYLLALSPSPTTLSRTCGIVGAYKAAFDAHPKPVADYYPLSLTNTFNLSLQDLYNLLWVATALKAADGKALGLYCDPKLRSELNAYLASLDQDYTIAAAFGVSNNAWLASLSAAAWRALEEREIGREGYQRDAVRYHEGPVSKRSLEVLNVRGGVSVPWEGARGYKAFVIRWLAERGLGGLQQFMFSAVVSLKG